MDNLLVIFAKAPIAGFAKTRLCPPLLPDEAAGLQRAFIADTLDNAVGAGGFDVLVAFTPDDARGLMVETCGGRPCDLAPQVGGDLGERMSRAFVSAFGMGYRKVAIVGTDSPALQTCTLTAAFDRLDRADMVIGPAEDGGYYLIGLKSPAPEVFKDIGWSGPEVLSETLAKAHGLGLSVELLPTLGDVDTFEDLGRISGSPLPKYTRAFLDGLPDRPPVRR